MKVTKHNKDHVARLIAENAWKQPNDEVSVNMLRVSDALTDVGTAFSPFRTLASFDTEFIPCGEGEHYEGVTKITYRQALNAALMIVASDLVIPVDKTKKG